jgi:hypothetical protein
VRRAGQAGRHGFSTHWTSGARSGTPHRSRQRTTQQYANALVRPDRTVRFFGVAIPEGQGRPRQLVSIARAGHGVGVPVRFNLAAPGLATVTGPLPHGPTSITGPGSFAPRQTATACGTQRAVDVAGFSARQVSFAAGTVSTRIRTLRIVPRFADPAPIRLVPNRGPLVAPGRRLFLLSVPGGLLRIDGPRR